MLRDDHRDRMVVARMSSQQYKLEKLEEKRRAGKRAIVKVGGVAYEFVMVRWGGTSPIVVLCLPGGSQIAHTAAEWKKLGAAS